MKQAEPNTLSLAALDAMAPGDEAAWLGGQPNALIAVRALCDQVEGIVLGDLHRATHLSERLVRLADALGEQEVRAAARRIRARALSYANDLDASLSLLADAERLLENTPNTPEGARIQLATLHSLARQGRHVQAIAAGKRARDLFSTAGELVQSARAEINIGAVERMRGEPRRALEAFARARGELTREPVLLAQLESNCAEALLDLGRFGEATSAFQASLEAFEAAGLERAAAIVEGNLADLFARQGQLESALRHFSNAQQRFGSLAAPGDAARLEVESADALAATGLRGEAIETYLHALPVLRSHGLAWEVIRGELGLGRALVEDHRVDEAEEAFTRARTASEALGNRAATARSLKGLAQTHDRRGDRLGARSLLLRAESMAHDLPVERMRIRLHIARLGGTSKDAREREAEMDLMVRQTEELGVPPLLCESLHVRARYRVAGGQMELAIKDYRTAIEQAERTRGMLQADRFRAAFADDRHSLYEECVGAVLDHDRGTGIAEAFNLVERSKGRALLDILSHRRDVPGREHASGAADTRKLLDELATRRAELNALYSELDEIDGKPGGARALEIGPWSLRAVEQEREIAHLERRLSSKMPRFMGGASTVDLEGTMARLGTGSTLLEYFGEAGMVSVIACEGGGRARVFRGVCSMDEVRDALEEIQFEVGRFVRGGSGGATGNVRDLFRRLHTMLIEPVEEVMQGTTSLIVVPTGPLYGVPFHALWGEAGAVGATCRVSQVPSASVMVQLKDREGVKAKGGSLVVGVSDASAPRAEDEASAVASVLPDCTLLVGKEATRARVLDASREKAFIHIASHGRFAGRHAAESGVRLADGWLTVRDAHDMQLDGAHVTLSACDTGRVLASPGDEAWGLVRGFLAGGAGSLLLSMWALNDESAAEIMAECSCGIQAGAEAVHPAESLRRELIKRANAGADPLMWAPFVYVGAL